MNALRDIASVEEIEVRLQSNEVLVHLSTDTPLEAVSSAIYEAGFQPDDSLWLTTRGSWTEDGFLPEGWAQPIEVERAGLDRKGREGPWELHFRHQDGGWLLDSVRTVTRVPQIKDEDTP